MGRPPDLPLLLPVKSPSLNSWGGGLLKRRANGVAFCIVVRGGSHFAGTCGGGDAPKSLNVYTLFSRVGCGTTYAGISCVGGSSPACFRARGSALAPNAPAIVGSLFLPPPVTWRSSDAYLPSIFPSSLAPPPGYLVHGPGCCPSGMLLSDPGFFP